MDESNSTESGEDGAPPQDDHPSAKPERKQSAAPARKLHTQADRRRGDRSPGESYPTADAPSFSMASPEFLSQPPSDVLRQAILRHVRYTLVRPMSELQPADYLKPVSLAIRDRIVDRMLETESRYRHKDSKRLYYLSMEWLMGRLLGNNLSNLRLEELCREVLASFGVSLDDVMESEIDAGLGNGGLGRLAACFQESMATLGMPGFGYGIDYEFGLFKQEIVNGFQREKPDRWKANGTPFQIEHPEEAVSIPLYGRVETQHDADGNAVHTWANPKIILGMPTDMPVVGYLCSVSSCCAG